VCFSLVRLQSEPYASANGVNIKADYTSSLELQNAAEMCFFKVAAGYGKTYHKWNENIMEQWGE
jgi:hypothetical protein